MTDRDRIVVYEETFTLETQVQDNFLVMIVLQAFGNAGTG